jgi:hypothetical protein
MKAHRRGQAGAVALLHVVFGTEAPSVSLLLHGDFPSWPKMAALALSASAFQWAERGEGKGQVPTTFTENLHLPLLGQNLVIWPQGRLGKFLYPGLLCTFITVEIEEQFTDSAPL